MRNVINFQRAKVNKNMISASVVQPLLTDQYQITMAYAYWRSGKTNETASFDLFFRKCPFRGEFTIFAGLTECLHFLQEFQFSQSDIEYLQTCFPQCEEEFFQFLLSLSPELIKVEAIPEGSVCFPRVPLIKVTGPLIMVQLLETVFLNLVNFASLIATNAARFRIAAGKHRKLFELGLRRAQGPDGGLSASKYAFIGGFDGTSNLLAGKLFSIPVVGTHAHSFVSSFSSLDQVKHLKLTPQNTESPAGAWFDKWGEFCVNLRQSVSLAINIPHEEANDGELAAFISYSASFPGSFTALLDTYDVLRSGVLNFCVVAIALHKYGYKARGVRIDSGDLAYLSNKIKAIFKQITVIFKLDWFEHLEIIASNDINEETILSLNEQGNSITTFGTGTHLVTCQRQPALGCVYKMVSISGEPTVKLSQDVEKMTMPGDKVVYRLFGKDGFAILDLIQLPEEEPPRICEKVLCRHPFEESKRAFVTPHKVEELHSVVWSDGRLTHKSPTLLDIRESVQVSLKSLRSDHLRSLNPTPYKVSVSDKLYNFVHTLWLEHAPIGELS